MTRNYAERHLDNILVTALLGWMRQSRAMGSRFDACLAEARKQFAREVRAEADATPLTK